MLARKSYPKSEVDAVRRMLRDQLAAYDALDVSDEKFECGYAQLVVLALDRSFVHRQRGLEAKGANPLGEVRTLADAIAAGGQADLSLAEVRQLCEDFLDELERRFPDAG